MANKFEFDQEHLDFKEKSKKYKIIKFIAIQFVGIVFVGVFIFFILSYFVDNPYEKNLKYKNKLIEKEYDKLLAFYQQNEKNLQTLEKQDYELYQVIFGKVPPQRNSSDLLHKIETENILEVTENNNKKLLELQQHLAESKADFNNIIKILENNQEEINNIPAIQPVANSNLEILLYGYGQKLDPIYRTPAFHTGIDFNVPTGTPVYATADGVVTKTGRGKKEYGLTVSIQHGKFTTVYQHLDEIKTAKGKKVKRGDVIGYAGNSGKALVSHLHYEVQYNNEHLNPIFFFFMDLAPNQFSKLYELSTRAGICLD